MFNKTRIASISVIGCGWLGFPLAKLLLSSGYQVKGSTTREEKMPELTDAGIEAYLVQINQEIEAQKLEDFLSVDLLIINIPPGRNHYVDYERRMLLLKNAALKSSVKKIIFISSSTVYQENNAVVNESSAINTASERSLSMFKAEEVFRQEKSWDATIIRMAGLVNEERHPGRFFSAKEKIPDALSPINLIHLKDCEGIILQVIEQNLWNQTFNACSLTHPPKGEFYTLAIQKYSGERKEAVHEKGNFKIVDASKIVETGYQFIYPDLTEWVSKT